VIRFLRLLGHSGLVRVPHGYIVMSAEIGWYLPDDDADLVPAPQAASAPDGPHDVRTAA
jgi:hypothetical protein